MAGLSIGDHVAPKAAVRPISQAAGTINGPAITRAAAQSCVLHHQTGAETGAPTARTVDSKLQDSADGSTGWADIAGATAPQITAVNTEAKASLSLLGSTKPFIRVVMTVGFTGGTTPAILVAAAVVLGGQRARPAA